MFGSKRRLLAKAARVRLVLTDCDGVLTDGGVYYSENGEMLKRFHMRDGMGVKRLRAEGIETGIVSGELSPSIAKRAEKLSIVELHLGIRDKLSLVTSLLSRLGLQWDEIAYIGDDVNDWDVLKRVGLSACPADAVPLVRETVDWVLSTRGGQGAFREFAERILQGKGKGDSKCCG
jgi:3-deoxy-D-manno-octulosonate 8-phosphate phosphatase (KDO 8-P phosphatase)